MVVRSTVFATSSAQKWHLARDAYYACWDYSPRRQERNCALGFLRYKRCADNPRAVVPGADDFVDLNLNDLAEEFD